MDTLYLSVTRCNKNISRNKVIFTVSNGVLVAFCYLSRYLHLIHGLQPTLDEFSGTENERREDRCHRTGARFLHIAKIERSKRVFLFFQTLCKPQQQLG